MCGKKVRGSYCSDINSILTKGMITFCWWMMVRMMMIIEKTYERISYSTICFMEWGSVLPIRYNFQIV